MHLKKDTIIGNVMMSQLVGLADDWSSISLKITEAYELSVCSMHLMGLLMFNHFNCNGSKQMP